MRRLKWLRKTKKNAATTSKSRKFQVERIVYNQNGFSIAVGKWVEDGTRRFAMRWNDSPTDKGYPSVFNNPMWFQLTDDIQGVINTLISNSNIEVRS